MAAFYDNPFWFDEHGAPLKKGALDFFTHTNFEDNVIVSATGIAEINDALTWLISYQWTPTAYEDMRDWLIEQGSLVPSFIPIAVTAGTGIGSTGSYAALDDIYIEVRITPA
jgi:hypothetical protein